MFEVARSTPITVGHRFLPRPCRLRVGRRRTTDRALLRRAHRRPDPPPSRAHRRADDTCCDPDNPLIGPARSSSSLTATEDRGPAMDGRRWSAAVHRLQSTRSTRSMAARVHAVPEADQAASQRPRRRSAGTGSSPPRGRARRITRTESDGTVTTPRREARRRPPERPERHRRPLYGTIYFTDSFCEEHPPIWTPTACSASPPAARLGGRTERCDHRATQRDRTRPTKACSTWPTGRRTWSHLRRRRRRARSPRRTFGERRTPTRRDGRRRCRQLVRDRREGRPGPTPLTAASGDHRSARPAPNLAFGGATVAHLYITRKTASSGCRLAAPGLPWRDPWARLVAPTHRHLRALTARLPAVCDTGIGPLGPERKDSPRTDQPSAPSTVEAVKPPPSSLLRGCSARTSLLRP